MKRLIYILLFFWLLPTFGFSQLARIYIKSGYMKLGITNFSTLDGPGTFNGKTLLVVDDSLTTAIPTPAAGGIISSGEFNMVQWNIGQNTGAYKIPFISDDNNSIPVSITISTAGVDNAKGSNSYANASITFSTWDTPSDNWSGLQSLTGAPADVTNMHAEYFQSNPLPSASDDSYNVVDRFWVIDAGANSSYMPISSKGYKAGHSPVIAPTFSYLSSGDAANTEVAAPNVFLESNLEPQRFNSTQGQWGDYFPTYTPDVPGGNVGSLAVNAVSVANWFRSWTLSNSLSPLPIKLLSFTVECQDGHAIIQWSTATEVNNNYFTVSRSSDGVNFQPVTVVKGAGTSSSTLNYSTTDLSPLFGTSYYNLSQTDLDGNTTIVGSTAYTSCGADGNTINAFAANDYIDVQINSVQLQNTEYTVILSTDLGQSLLNETKSIAPGQNEFKLYPEVATGVYFLTITDNNTVYHKKILIKK